MDPGIKIAPPRPGLEQPALLHIYSLPYWVCRLYFAKKNVDNYPRFQYKYKALAVDPTEPRARHLRALIVENRLWLSSPRDFNDPFDMTAHVTFEGDTNKIRQRFKQLIADRSGKGWKERKALLEQYMARPRNEWQEAAERAFSQSLDQIGVFSFADDPRSVVMWSHYGDHHIGICLQFEVARDPETMLVAVPVKYVTDYPILNWAGETAEQLNQILLNKFERWRYEGESRIVWPGGAHTYLPFKPAALVGLIFGCRATEPGVKVVTAMLEERKALGLPDIRIYRAEKHSSRYGLVIRRAT
jgi:hypothetical protein